MLPKVDPEKESLEERPIPNKDAKEDINVFHIISCVGFMGATHLSDFHGLNDKEKQFLMNMGIC